MHWEAQFKGIDLYPNGAVRVLPTHLRFLSLNVAIFNDAIKSIPRFPVCVRCEQQGQL